MAHLCEQSKAAIADTLGGAAYGERRRTADRLADLYGVSVSTVYRVAGLGGAARPRPAREEYRAWVQTAVALAHRAPGEPVSLDLAIEAGIKTGELPPEAAAMPLASAYRIRRELGLHRGDARSQRMSADYPMQAAQFDGSTSMYISVVGQQDDGDWQLRLYRRPIPARGYKNKPLGPDRERLMTYGLWDMCTGYRLSTYAVARGENALDAVEALVWMLSEKDDTRLVLHGVPDDLWLDQGPITKSSITTDLLHRLGINLVTGEPYRKTRMGGVERAWRTLWARFERALFLLGRDELTLSELNARLMEYLVRENDRRPARVPVGDRRVSRTAAWTALTNARAGENRLRRLPPNALATLAAEAPRRVDRNGHLRWDGQVYEAPTLFDCWVTARRAPDGAGDVVIEHADTRIREVARPIEKRRYGDIRATEKLPLEKLLDAAPDARLGADVYTPAPQVADNVRSIPIRSAPAIALADPLDAGHHTDLDEALRAFYAYYPYPLGAADRAAVITEIEAAGLQRQAVVDLANELLTHTALGGIS